MKKSLFVKLKANPYEKDYEKSKKKEFENNNIR